MNLRLASQLRETTDTLGAQLRAKRQAQIEAERNAQKAEIEKQIKEAPIVAQRLIKGLPSFLERCANAEHSRAYVVCRSGCKPWERDFPNHVEENRRSSYDHGNMTEYAIRRYMKGTIQHVALWGLKQGLRVGIGHIRDSQEIEYWERHNRMVPVYMPGVFWDYIPTGHNSDFLYFSW
jgi:hypothetical protein